MASNSDPLYGSPSDRRLCGVGVTPQTALWVVYLSDQRLYIYNDNKSIAFRFMFALMEKWVSCYVELYIQVLVEGLRWLLSGSLCLPLIDWPLVVYIHGCFPSNQSR